MRSSFEKGTDLFQERERSNQEQEEHQDELRSRSSWTKAEITNWLDDYLLALQKKIGPGLHVNYDKFNKSILVLGPFPFGLDIDVVGHSLLRNEDEGITPDVLKSIEFRLIIPSTLTLRNRNVTEYQDLKVKHKIQSGLRDLILDEIKGSHHYPGNLYSCFTVIGASNLELILGYFCEACDDYLQESEGKTPPWDTFFAKNRGTIDDLVKLIGTGIIALVFLRLVGFF